MKKCDNDCHSLCDFCIHYDFNGDEDGAYIGEGYCNLHKEHREPWSDCNEFHCFNVKEVNE